jgi:hypothetical protein
LLHLGRLLALTSLSGLLIANSPGAPVSRGTISLSCTMLMDRVFKRRRW